MTIAALDRATIERLGASEPLLIALSGGGDSTALLHLMVKELGAARLIAGIVDHRLRSGSAADATRAAEIAAALGVRSEIIALEWPNGPVRAQAAARDGRYGALCAMARRLGAGFIVTAHTSDDQAETVLMRAASGSSWRGLAGMSAIAPAPIWPEGRGVALVRPLLQAGRADLRALLRAEGASWIEDPSNENTVFARVRARKRLAELAEAGFDTARLTRLAAALRPLADRIDAEARALIAASTRFADGEAVIAPERWSGDAQARRRALSALLTAAAGAAREPSADAVAALEARLGSKFRGGTLGGARVRADAGAWRIGRDAGAMRGRADGARPLQALALPQGAEIVWDGRLALTALAPGWSAEVAADGKAPVLAKGEERLAFADALRCGIVTADWLVAAHAGHILPVHHPVMAPVA